MRKLLATMAITSAFALAGASFSLYAETASDGYPYCTNGSSDTGGGWGWDPAVTDPKGTHSCHTRSAASTGTSVNTAGTGGGVASDGYPNCTNGSSTGGGWGWDPAVTDPKGTHSCHAVGSGGSTGTSGSAAGGVASDGYPNCTNGSSTGGGWGWDPAVTDPKGTHSCHVAGSGGTGSGSAAGGVASDGFPYCTNGSDTGGSWGWDPAVTDPKGNHSCHTAAGATSSRSLGGTAQNGKPYCTGNAGKGFGNAFACDRLSCAKNDEQGTVICVVSSTKINLDAGAYSVSSVPNR